MVSVIAFVICYLVGSVPTAYLIVKSKTNLKLTKEGSGNVGTLNAIVVSKSKLTGIIVLLLDIAKGFLPVYFMFFVFKLDYSTAAFASCFLILGHNYPVWLKFKGGRGLATGTGIFLIMNYFVLAGWCVVWAVCKLLKKDVLFANTFATLGMFGSILLVNLFDFFSVSYGISSYSLKYFTISSSITALIVLIGHLEVFKSFFNKNKI